MWIIRSKSQNLSVGSAVAQCLMHDGGVAGSRHTGVTAWCPLVRHINPCLVFVQPRKTPPDINEKLFTGT